MFEAFSSRLSHERCKSSCQFHTCRVSHLPPFVLALLSNCRLPTHTLLSFHQNIGCIRGSYGSVADDKVTTPLVWQLDYTSPDTETRQFIHVHEFSSTPARVNRPHFRFTILMKDGKECSIWVRLSGDQVRWEAPWREGGKRDVDMTDGCSLMSYSVGLRLAFGFVPAVWTDDSVSQAMRILAEMYAEARGAAELKPSLPPVAQGRLGPGKGAPVSSDHCAKRYSSVGSCCRSLGTRATVEVGCERASRSLDRSARLAVEV